MPLKLDVHGQMYLESTELNLQFINSIWSYVEKAYYGKIFNIMLAKGYKGQDGSGILSFHQQVSRKIDLHFPS